MLNLQRLLFVLLVHGQFHKLLSKKKENTEPRNKTKNDLKNTQKDPAQELFDAALLKNVPAKTVAEYLKENHQRVGHKKGSRKGTGKGTNHLNDLEPKQGTMLNLVNREGRNGNQTDSNHNDEDIREPEKGFDYKRNVFKKEHKQLIDNFEKKSQAKYEKEESGIENGKTALDYNDEDIKDPEKEFNHRGNHLKNEYKQLIKYFEKMWQAQYEKEVSDLEKGKMLTKCLRRRLNKKCKRYVHIKVA